MKTTVKSLGIAVLAVTLVFAFLGCKEPEADEPLPPPSLPSHSSLSVIKISAIEGVAVPTKDGIPVTTITENAQYRGTVTWSPAVNENETFVIFTEYTAYITLTAKAGFTLQGVPADFFTVDGAKSVSNDANSGVITAEFPPTTDVISIAAIKGVTVPKNGEVPTENITENAQYSGTVSWSPFVNERFAAITSYTATITLTAKSDFTLQGVSADFFKIDGAISVRNDANSGVITAVFPTTEPTSIGTVNISITAPAKGATPIAKATVSGQVNYDIGTVTWLPSVTNNKFLGGTRYTASVKLTAKQGYTFTGLSSATINEQNAVISDNNGSTVKLSYTFPATSDKIVTNLVIKTQPAKHFYTHGDKLDLTGLVVTLTYDSTSTDTEDIPAENFAAKNITTNPAQDEELIYSTHNNKYIVVTCGDLTKNSDLLSISRAAPTAAIFDISGTGTFTYDGNPKTVTITPKNGITTGNITVKYNGSTTKPSSAGTYPVTFDVGFLSNSNYSNASGLSAGTLTIEKAVPVASDFNISNNVVYYDGNSKSVTITQQTGKSNGERIVKYNGSTVAPSAVGTYTVTFDVAEGTNYKAASGLSAGTLTINSAVFTSIPELQAYLKSRVANTASSPYNVVLNVDDLGGSSLNSGSLGYALRINSTKYVNIDLSGSTFTMIETDAFCICSSLIGITIPNNIESIENYAFSNCNNLPSINIPNSVINIGNYAFNNCTRFTSVTIGNSVTSIGSNAFYGCTSLASVAIGNSVTSIGSYAFQGCTSLTAINVDTGNSAYSSQDGVLFNKKKTTLIIYPISKVGAFIIPNTVTGIGIGIFEGCADLTSITIPSTVRSIGSNAFKGCTSLIEVKFEGTIASASFNSSAFGVSDGEGYIGDLRVKFYASNSTNGTAGIYTRQNDSSGTWTKTAAKIITVDPIPDQQYTGSSIQPVVTVKDGTKTLTLNTDYTVSYTNNTQAGTATVTINGVGSYIGSSVSTTFAIIRITPVAADFNITGTGTFTYDGSVKTVTITPKEGKSNGTITVKYNGSTTAPSTLGTYTVTFDVAAVTGFNAVSGLSAGTLIIEKGTPTAADFNISGLTQYYDGSPKTVTITPKNGITTGNITVKYGSSTTAPSAVGTYIVTFDVAEGTNHKAASGLSAGTLTIIANATPTAADFNISGNGTFTYNGNSKTVTITPKEGKSNGAITVKYNGSTTAPSAVGVYTVTFDVAAVTGFNAVSGLSVGTLTIIKIEMVSIPAGTFTMGQPGGIKTPEHSVTLSGFYMGKYQVTQEQYQAVMGSNPSSFSSSPQAGETQGKRPVERVIWYDALVFCNKLSAMEGLSPAYSISGSTDPATWGSVPPGSNTTWDAVTIVSGSTGYRLPTEAQWEYACRAGTTTKYNTGDTISDSTGWYSSNSGSKTHEVGLKPANAWGLYDMHGNVWEWCWDWYGDYSSSAQTDPMGASSGTYGTYRVLRGGCWLDPATGLRSADRNFYNPSYRDDGDPNCRYDALGFRLVRP